MRARKTPAPEAAREMDRLPTEAEQRILVMLFAKGPLTITQLSNLLVTGGPPEIKRHMGRLVARGLLHTPGNVSEALRLNTAGRDLTEVCGRHGLFPNETGVPIRKSAKWMDASVVAVQAPQQPARPASAQPPAQTTTPAARPPLSPRDDPDARYLPWREESARVITVTAPVKVASSEPPAPAPRPLVDTVAQAKPVPPPERPLQQPENKLPVVSKPVAKKPAGPMKRPTLPFNPALLSKRK